MAALNKGLTNMLWWGLRVVVYAERKEAESSSLGLDRFSRRDFAVKSRPLSSECEWMFKK